MVRYVEVDPIGLKGGSNLYTYAESSPLNSFDPSGKVACKNNSGISIPYKHENDDFTPPRTCQSGQDCDIDGFYMPDHRVVKVFSYITYLLRGGQESGHYRLWKISV